MYSSQQHSLLPNYFQTVLTFMGFRSETDLNSTNINEEFFKEFESSAERLLKLKNELGTRFQLELMQAGQDASTFKLLRGHKQILQQLGTQVRQSENTKEKDEEYWSVKLKQLSSAILKKSDIIINQVTWKTNILSVTVCPHKSCGKLLKLRKNLDKRNKLHFAVHHLTTHLKNHK